MTGSAPRTDEQVGLGRVLCDVVGAAGLSIAVATLAVVPACCLVFVPVFLAMVGEVYERIMGVRASSVARWRVGVVGAPIFLVPLFSLLVALSLVERPDGSTPAGWTTPLVTMGVSTVLTIVLFPLYGAPFEAIARGTGMLDGWIGSGARAARRGLLVTFATGAAVGALGSAPWLVVALLAPALRRTPYAWVIFVLLATAAVASVTVCLAITARFWSGGRERFGKHRPLPSSDRSELSEAGSSRERLGTSLAVSLAPLGLLGVLLVLALATPSPAWRRASSEEVNATAGPRYALSTPRTVPGRSALTFSSPRDDVWLVQAADGGGVGEVRVRGGDEARAELRRDRFRGRDGWTVRVPIAGPDVALFTVDDDGVRLDDGPRDRLAARLGGSAGLAAAGVTGILAVALATLQLRALGIAAGLDRPRFRGRRETVAIEGTLRAVEPVLADAGELRVVGAARLELGDLGSVRLPEGTLPLLVSGPPEVLTDGARITMVATLGATSGSPFREGAAPLPRDARFVLGALDRAREAFAEQAARRSAAFSLPIAALALALGVVVVIHL